MKYGTDMDLGAIIWIPSYTEIGLGIQKLMGVRKDSQDTQTYKHHTESTVSW